MRKITFIVITVLLLTLAATIPIKTYQRRGCLVNRFQRLDMIMGESIEDLDSAEASFIPGATMGVCYDGTQTVRLYIL